MLVMLVTVIRVPVKAVDVEEAYFNAGKRVTDSAEVDATTVFERVTSEAEITTDSYGNVKSKGYSDSYYFSSVETDENYLPLEYYDTITVTYATPNNNVCYQLYVDGVKVGSEISAPATASSGYSTFSSVRGTILAFTYAQSGDEHKFQLRIIRYDDLETGTISSSWAANTAGIIFSKTGDDLGTCEETEFFTTLSLGKESALTGNTGIHNSDGTVYFCNEATSQKTIKAQYSSNVINAGDFDAVCVKYRAQSNKSVNVYIGETLIASGKTPSNSDAQWYSSDWQTLVLPITNKDVSGVVTLEVSVSSNGWSGHYSDISFADYTSAEIVYSDTENEVIFSETITELVAGLPYKTEPKFEKKTEKYMRMYQETEA